MKGMGEIGPARLAGNEPYPARPAILPPIAKVENPRSKSYAWLLAARPKTLFAAVGPVLLGTLFAATYGYFHALAALCALLGAIFIQVGTNLANDYQDFLRGADTEARKGPLRVTQSGLLSAQEVRIGTGVAFGLAFLAGAYLIARGGWPILALGLICIGSGIAYTAGRYALAYTGLADIFVLIFFGPVAVAGTYYVQSLVLHIEPVVAGLGAGFLATAILIANNVRDVEEDRAASKRTLVVRFGRRCGVRLYGVCISGAVAVPAAMVLWLNGRPGALVASLIASLVGRSLTTTLANNTDSSILNPLLGKTALLLFVYCAAFGLGWMLT
ncbi:1,4-dihydroxy-2-naphthoate polyprenyltransferase [soil metagenome]